MINTTKIYLVTNCFGDPNKVYIGKTKNSREINHSKTYGSQIIYTYIDEVNSLKYKDWEPLETFWIEYFKFLGFILMNVRKSGGSGPSYYSEETKQKMRMSHKGRKISEEWKENMRKPKSTSKKGKEHGLFGQHIHTEESKRKLKIKQTQNAKERGEKISKTKLGRKYPEGYIKKLN